MPVFYSLVARQKAVLVDFSNHPGNFPEVARQVLETMNMDKVFGQFATSNYIFITFVKEGLVFLVMVEADYEIRIAASFLKKIQEKFFEHFDSSVRNTAAEHSLHEFQPILNEWMEKYSNKESVDKLSQLKKQLAEVEAQHKLNLQKLKKP